MKSVLKKIFFILQVILVFILVIPGIDLFGILRFRISAQNCPIPEIVSTSITLTPTSEDNIIDCSDMDITIVSGGELIIANYKVSDTSSSNDGGVVFKVQNLTVESGGKINADGMGYISTDSDSSGIPDASLGHTGGSGGGHGGSGGEGLEDGINSAPTPGVANGTSYSPVLLGGAGGAGGDGGAGGAGGGALKIDVFGTLRIDGSISANGLDGSLGNLSSGGGGAGGSIWIDADVLAGIGSVEANGGGTDQEALYPGGGGGGGRIVMFGRTGNNFSGNATANPGLVENAQDGGIGSLVGPTTIPAIPSILKQFRTDGSTEISVGGVTTQTSVIFSTNLIDADSSDTLLLQIELRPLEEAFTNVPTHTQSSPLSNPKNCVSGVSFDCGSITVNNLSRNTSYHWQARVRDSHGGVSDWVSFGENSESAGDLVIAGTANVISLTSGDSQSAEVATELALPLVVRIVDTNGNPSQGYDVTWQITNGSGGGVFLDGNTTKTNADGYAQNRYKVGNNAGTNLVRAVASGLTGSPVVFTLTGEAGSIHHFEVSAPQYAITNQNFADVTITARDIYGNAITNYGGTPTLTPVSPNSPYGALAGTLSPSSIQFVSQDTVVISEMTYNTAESIKIQVQDGSAVGRSNTIAVVTSLGTCPDADGIIDSNQTWSANATNKGIFDCSGLSLQITNNAILTLVSYDSGDTIYTNDYGTTVIADNITVNLGAKISGDGQGYAITRGPGAGSNNYCNAKGPSHGGYGNGSLGSGNIYGDVYEPNTLGSGTGSQYGGAKGGGAIKLIVNGTTTVNGTISANGGVVTTDCNTGGSGGSIWIDTNEFVAGSSSVISAQGKPGAGKPQGGSGGGRIAVYYNTTSVDIPSYVSSGKINTFGASSGGYTSGSGTIYTEQKGVDPVKGGALLVDNNNLVGKSAALLEGSYQFKSIHLTRKGNTAVLGSNSRLEVPSNSTFVGDSTKSDIIVEGLFVYTGEGALSVNGVNLGIKGDISGVADFSVGTSLVGGVTLYASTWAHNKDNQYTFDDITVGGFGTLSLVSYDSGDTNYTNDYGIVVTAENISVSSGGIITGNGLGYGAARGPGVGTNGSCVAKGPSHGGYGNGANGSGTTYGDVYEPNTLGSATGSQYGSSAGGGAIKLIVSGTMTVNGTVSADGAMTSGDCNTGGAGGSLWIDTNELVAGANSVISAQGKPGTSRPAGGGGGGRIALYYNTTSVDIPSYVLSGKINTFGASSGGYTSGAGTIYAEQKGVDPVKGGVLLVDNNNLSGKSATLMQGFYQFSNIKATRKGDLDIIGNSSYLVLTSGSGISGDSSFPNVTVNGTIVYTGSGIFGVNGYDLGVKGDIAGVSDISIGTTQTGGMTLYASTWAHDENSPYVFGDISVGGLGTMSLVSYDSGDTNYTNDYGTTVVADNVTVSAGGVITANGLGYGITRGPGAGSNNYCNAKGPSHGGYGNGSLGSGNIYGDVYEPNTLGSGTGSQYGGASGGGSIKLIVGGTTTVNGTISANGGVVTTDCNTGGSGGSIWIDTNEFVAGSSSVISAQGKPGAGKPQGGSGGGRIALYYNTTSVDIPSYVSSGKINTFGASSGGYTSGAGTIYTEQKGVDQRKGGHLLIDNNNLVGKGSALTEGTYQFEDIKLTREGDLNVLGDTSYLILTSAAGILGDSSVPKVTILGTLSYTGEGTFSVNGYDLGIKGDMEGISDVIIGSTNPGGMTLYANTWAHNKENQYTLGDITVGTQGTMTLVSYDSGDTNYTNDYGTTISAENVTVETGGVITADGLGYAEAKGPGAGDNNYCNAKGPSHGGYGNGNLGSSDVYGDIYQPDTLGSGSGNFYGGSAGGGAIKLLVSGTTTVNGTISANGNLPLGDCSTGSAGGSIWIDTNEFVAGSSSVISAQGKPGNVKPQGASGGGRIALYYNTTSVDIPSYVSSGKINTFGASSGGYTSGAGTIYIEDKQTYESLKGDLYIHNNGIYAKSMNFEAKEYFLNDVYIGENVQMKALGNSENNTGTILNLTGDFTLSSGAFIDGIGQGFDPAGGPGAGSNGTGLSGGGGGAHGGSGGNGFADSGSTINGGVFYGSQRQPMTLGSGGGSSGNGALGGKGGGAFTVLAKEGKVTILGTINASGTDGSISGSEGGGGGAGGSIYIYANSCDITGTLRANGGNGGNATFSGGGGGGGRLSFLYIEGPCDVEGATEVVSGVSANAQSGQEGTFPAVPNSVPYPTGPKSQYEFIGTLGVGDITNEVDVLGASTEDPFGGIGDSTVEIPIPIGGIINGNNVMLRSAIFDAGASPLTPKSLKMEVEIKKTGEQFDGTTGIFSSGTEVYTGGDAIVMGALATNLELGASYKWRVRATNTTTELSSDWKEFGDNGEEADFVITEVERIELQSSNYELELGQKADLRITVYDMYDNISEQYSGELTLTVNSIYGNLLVDSVQYQSGIPAIMDILNAVYFTKAGTYEVSAYDPHNDMLTDTITITVLSADESVLTLFASKKSITEGNSVVLTWVSEGVTGLTLSYDDTSKSVDGLNRLEVSPLKTTEYTLEGMDEDGNRFVSTVTVTVVPKVIPEEGEEEIPVDEDEEVKENIEQGGYNNNEKFEDNRWILSDRVLNTSFVASTILLAVTSVVRFIIDFSWQILLRVLPFIKGRKRDQKYSVVYDSITKSPICGAVVRILDEENSIIATAVTDIFGIFDAKLKEGKYKFSIKAVGYEYPSKVISGDSDDPYTNIYNGGSFNYKDGEILNISVPMDPENRSFISYSSSVVMNRLSNIVQFIQYILIVIGVTLLVVSIQNGIDTLDIVSIFIYSLVIILNLIILIKNRKKYGVLSTSNGDVLKGTEILLRELEFDQIVGKRVTDDLGRYRFVVRGGHYRLELADSRYKIMPDVKSEYIGKDNSVLIIKDDIRVRSK